MQSAIYATLAVFAVFFQVKHEKGVMNFNEQEGCVRAAFLAECTVELTARNG